MTAWERRQALRTVAQYAVAVAGLVVLVLVMGLLGAVEGAGQ